MYKFAGISHLCLVPALQIHFVLYSFTFMGFTVNTIIAKCNLISSPQNMRACFSPTCL